ATAVLPTAVGPVRYSARWNGVSSTSCAARSVRFQQFPQLAQRLISPPHRHRELAVYAAEKPSARPFCDLGLSVSRFDRNCPNGAAKGQDAVAETKTERAA